MTQFALTISNVSRSYGTHQAVRQLNMTVAEGEFISLLGPSGCGKTTTLRLIAGLDQPTSGDICFRGQRTNEIAIHKRNCGIVFQSHALFPHRTIFENIAFGLRFRGFNRADIASKVRNAMRVIRLEGVEDRMPSQLSGGQQQRVAVARAIVIEPDLLLFDEPLSALDAGLREELRVEIRRIQNELGITTIYVTHDQDEALSMSDRVALLRAGQLEQFGTPRDIYTKARSEFVARFFGSVFKAEGTVESLGNDETAVRLTSGKCVRVKGNRPVGQKLNLMARGEHLEMKSAGDASLSGRVEGHEYFGAFSRYSLMIEGQLVHMLMPSHAAAPLRTGEQVSLDVAASSWMVVEPDAPGGSGDAAAEVH